MTNARLRFERETASALHIIAEPILGLATEPKYNSCNHMCVCVEGDINPPTGTSHL